MTPTPPRRIPRLSGSTSSNLSAARRRALEAIEEDLSLPEMQWERAGLNAPRASTTRRIPLAGADILRRYERSSAPKVTEVSPPSPSTTSAIERRAEFASKVHGTSAGTLSSSGGGAVTGKVGTKSNSADWKKDFAAAAKSDPSLGGRTRGATAAAAIALDSGIRSAYATLPVGGGGGGAGSSGGGWDDNFGDGDGDDSCGSSGDDFWDDCCDNDWNNWYWNSWYPGYWGWWSNWGMYWRPGFGFCYGSWFGPAYWSWYSSPYYSYPYYYGGSSWAWDYCTPIVVSTTIQTTEIIEVPVIEEVIAGAEVGSPEEVKSALQRAAVEYLSLGDRAFAEARYGDAVRHYARSVECSPNDPVLHLVLSDALFATGDYHYAAHCLRRALELNPNLLEVEFDKRGFYGDPSDFDRHLLLLQSYLNDHVLDDDARLLLGANLLFGGNPDATVALFSDILGESVQNSDSGRLLLAAAHRSIAAR